MASDTPRSALAKKALAFKAKHDAEASARAVSAQAVAAQKEAAGPRWGDIGRDLGSVVRAINDELSKTGTQIELRWDGPNAQRERLNRTRPSGNRLVRTVRGETLSTAILKVTLDGRHVGHRRMTVAGYDRGTARVHDPATGEHAVVDFADMDPSWIDKRIRAFIDAVLTEGES
ncbi:hypothetical protein [Methylobacterium sp. 1030]|uniref:hypothetical protein n=1 Tax=Methylobacterium sp. 1030 TaxID=3156404 RepID=UPI00339763A6